MHLTMSIAHPYPHTPADMPLAGIEVDNVWHPGFTCYGVEIGSPGYIKHMLGERLSNIKNEVDNLMDLLKNQNQAAWVVLSSSLAQTLDYSLTLQYSSDVLEVARALDARLWTALEQLAGQPRIPKIEEGLGFECLVAKDTGVAELEGRTYQHLMIAQPVKLGGCGLRSLEETRCAAFVGGVEMALPFLVEGDHDEEVLCPQLEEVIGRLTGEQRWSRFLEAGSRTSKEFQEAWLTLTAEAISIFNFLEEEPSGPLSVPTAEAGGRSTDGSTRMRVVQQKEMLRYKLMDKALSNFSDTTARPVTAFQNIAGDKCAGRWLLAIPSPDLALTPPLFKEAISAHLLLPSPAVREGGWLGREVPGGGGEVIDLHGDAIMNSSRIPGDSWRKRHDTVKQHVMAEAALAGIPSDCEVYGLFSNLLPAALTEVGGELHMAQARQGKVPDFRFLLPTPDGPNNCLAELKVISAGKTWFPRGTAGNGTERRAESLKRSTRGHCATWMSGSLAPPQLGLAIETLPQAPSSPDLELWAGLNKAN